MFENLSLGHLLFVLVAFLLLFGAKRLPEVGQSLGQGIREFKRSFSELRPDEPLPRAREERETYRPAPVERVEEERSEPKRLMR